MVGYSEMIINTSIVGNNFIINNQVSRSNAQFGVVVDYHNLNQIARCSAQRFTVQGQMMHLSLQLNMLYIGWVKSCNSNN
jgi:hypothetical protein